MPSVGVEVIEAITARRVQSWVFISVLLKETQKLCL